MAEPYLSEIRLFSFGFAPKGWSLCEGQTLPINQNQALFSLLGTTYGGNGTTTFQLPDLRGRAPIHFGNGFTLGQEGGTENATLLVANLPIHAHTVSANNGPATTRVPTGAALASPARDGPAMYGAAAPNVSMSPNAVGLSGDGTPLSTFQPTFVLNFCIALNGIFPSRN